MRLLSVQHYPVFGGPHNELLLLNKEFVRKGITTIVAITDEPGNAVARLSGELPVRTLRLGRFRLGSNPYLHAKAIVTFLSDVRRIREIIRSERIGLVKVHGPHNPHGAIAAALENVPVVWVVSSTRVPRIFRGIGARLVSRFGDSILVNGERLVQAYPGLEKAGRKIYYYYPPVDLARFVPLPDSGITEMRRELQIPETSPVVGTVANINPMKGIDDFLRVAAIVRERIPGCYFVVVGANSSSHKRYGEEVRRLAGELGLAHWIRFTGYRNDVHRVVGGFSVKVISSKPDSEGTTTTAGEAMACRVPVVASDVGAVSEVVDDGRTGFVYSPQDLRGAADRIVRLLDDPIMRRDFGEAARQRVIDRFSIKSCVDAHIRAFEGALSVEKSTGRN